MKKSKEQPIELDFESVVKAWETKKITRDQLAEHLKELGHDPEFVIESLEYDERQEIGEKMKQAFDRGDFEEALDASIEILNRLGYKRGWRKNE